MARLPRIVIPDTPYHIVQRGNRRQLVFFSDHDRRLYLSLLGEQARRYGLAIWAYCLMPNHVHIIGVPRSEDSLRSTFGNAHRIYSRSINFREGWRGYLFQGRFGSFAMDSDHLVAAMRYVERNPVEAGLVQHAEDYLWSSARHHVYGHQDPLVRPHFLQQEIPDWGAFLRTPNRLGQAEFFRLHSRTGRPLGSEDFVTDLEQRVGKVLRPRAPGRKSRPSTTPPPASNSNPEARPRECV